MQAKITTQIKPPIYSFENLLHRTYSLKTLPTHRLEGWLGSENILLRYRCLTNGNKLKNTCGFKLFVYIPLNLTENKNLTGNIIAGINLYSFTDCSDLYQLGIWPTLLHCQGKHSAFA